MTSFWLGWVVIVLVSFGIAEVYGYRKHGTKGTLSYHVWCVMFRDASDSLRGEKVDRPRAFVWFMVAAFFIWLAVHFLSGGIV